MNGKNTARVGDLSFVEPKNSLTLDDARDTAVQCALNNYDDSYCTGYTYSNICQAGVRAVECEESSPGSGEVVETDDVYYFDKKYIIDTIEETLRPLIERAVEEMLDAQKVRAAKIEKYHIKYK